MFSEKRKKMSSLIGNFLHFCIPTYRSILPYTPHVYAPGVWRNQAAYGTNPKS